MSSIALCVFGLQACGGGTSIEDVRALQAKGNFEASIEPLLSILEDEPDSGEANFLLGRAYYQTKRPSLAIWSLRKAEDDPEWAEQAGLTGAMALIQTHNNEEAIKTASRVLEKNPDQLEGLGFRAQARLAAVVDLEAGLADIERVLELDPDNETALQPKAALLIRLERIDEAAEVIAKIEEHALAGVDTGKPALHWCIARAIFAHEKGEYGLAEQRFEQCRESYPGEAIVIREVVRFYTETQRYGRAEELLRDWLEAKPAHLEFAMDLSARLRARGESSEAAAVLQSAVDAQPPGREFDALWALFEYYEDINDLDTAVEVLDRAMRQNPDPRLRFRLVDVLIRSGRHAEALEAAEELEGEVYVELAKGRILLDQGRPKEALQRLNAGIRLWPNNPGARYYAARAAEQLGDFDLAILEYRDSVRSGAADTDAGLRLARLLYAEASYTAAMNSLGQYQQAHEGGTLESAELAIKLASKLGQRALLDKSVAKMRALPGGARRAVVLRAEAGAMAGGQVAVVAKLRESGFDLSDPANIEVLRGLVEALVKMGAVGKALEEVDRAVAQTAEPAVFQELRAQVLRAQDADISEVRAACESAVQFDPNAPRNLSCLAWVEGEQGNVGEALELYDRAAALDPEEAAYPLAAARLQLAKGDAEDGERRLRLMLLAHPYRGLPAAMLARRWVERGVRLDQALRLARRANRFRAGPEVLDTLGWIQLERGETKAAINALNHAVEASGGAASVRYRLARALEADGRNAEARDALSQALETESFPERDRAQADLERLRRL